MPESEVSGEDPRFDRFQERNRGKDARIDGVIRAVIVFVEAPADSILMPAVEDFFAEMEPFMVKVGGADDSWEAINPRLEGART